MCLIDLKMRRIEPVSCISDFPDLGQGIEDELLSNPFGYLRDSKAPKYSIQFPA